MPQIHLLIPGDIETLTGGYGYDREVAVGLSLAGWRVEIEQLPEDLSKPEARAHASERMAAMRDGALVLVDGLALADLADILESHSARLRLVAILHHPAALETGLPAEKAADIAREEIRGLRAMQDVVCTSRWTARALLDSGLSSERIHVVEPGVDFGQALNASQPRRRSSLTAFTAGLRLLCVATITPRKGHDVLVRALARLSDLPWSLQCVGSRLRAPAHANRIESLIRANGLDERIMLLGEVDRDTLANAYAEADLFVLASRLEGYGMVLAEARAAGLPIVATEAGAVAETLAEASAVIVAAESADALAAALRRIMAEQAVWQKLADAATARVGARRDWARVTAELEAILQPQLPS